MRDIRDPDTGELIETMDDDDWADAFQEALRRRLIAFTGKAIYMRVGSRC
jgi:hypothetical protein